MKEINNFEIKGGRKLHGTIKTNTSKNGAIALLPAALLNEGETILHGIPKIEEVHRMIELLKSIGVSIKWLGVNSVKIKPPKKYQLERMNKEVAAKIRVSLYLIGVLGGKFKNFRLPHSGGCKMGKRTISAHRYAFLNMGLRIKTLESEYLISRKKLRAADFTLYEASVSGAINAIFLAAQIPGKTTIDFIPPNYPVQEICFFMEKLGIKMEGIGTNTLVVYGGKKINQKITYYNSEDPIETMMFISAAVVTKSKLKITRAPIEFLRLELLKLRAMGLKYQKTKAYLSKNNRTKLVDLIIHPSRLRSLPDKIHAQPYPGINSDNLPFFVPIATQARGTTMIHDWMWENRAIYFTELNKLGANITLADPHRTFIQGPTELKAAQVIAPPALRPAMIIFIAMLAAKGTSTLRNTYPINRGYEDIVQRFNKLGAKIKATA